MNLIKTPSSASIETMWNNNENNFAEIETNLNLFLGLFDDFTGNFTLTTYSEGKITAKELQIPIGNNGITVGYSVISDNKIKTNTIEYNSTIRSNTSTQYVIATTNLILGDGGVVNITEGTSTLIINPTLSSLQFEVDTPLNSIQMDYTIINLSTNDNSIDLKYNTGFVNNFSTITINKGGSLTLKYVNDINTNTEGWVIVSMYDCIVN